MVPGIFLLIKSDKGKHKKTKIIKVHLRFIRLKLSFEVQFEVHF